MGIRMRDLLNDALRSLRYEPTEKRLRMYLGGDLVADTVHGLLVWEPRRLVPTYAIPQADFVAELDSAGRVDNVSGMPVLVPTNPFAAHSCTGEMFDVLVGGRRCASAAFRPDDADLAGYLSLDFSAFDWREEDEPIDSHPHDPFKRIDILDSSRHIRIELDGRLLAESSRPLLLFETGLPTRFYLPPTDLVADVEPSDTISDCAYKGRASYFSVPGGPTDIAWTYRDPLREALLIRDHIAFFDERVDVIIGGRNRPRPVTPFSD